MGAKKNVTKEMILRVGMAIVEEGEIVNINARLLAKRLSCSTQPIYDSFKNMDDFKEQLLDYVRSFYYSFIEANRDKKDNLYFQYMKNYLKFAHDHPNLFQFIFVLNRRKETMEEKRFNEEIIEGIMKAGNYSLEAAKGFFIQSWVFSHGIAMQLCQKYIDWDFNDVLHLLNDNFEALRMFYKGK